MTAAEHAERWLSAPLGSQEGLDALDAAIREMELDARALRRWTKRLNELIKGDG
jgi:hypothetical protein